MPLIVTKVSGNIYSNPRRAAKAGLAGKSERLLVSRAEMDRHRLRRKTDRGTDIGLVLEHGSKLRHGDILEANDKLIVVEQVPEKVASVTFGKRNSPAKMADAAALVGHAIGNRHRPIAVHDGRISFPVNDASETEIFKTLLPKGTRIRITRQIFVPTGDEVHHHG